MSDGGMSQAAIEAGERIAAQTMRRKQARELEQAAKELQLRLGFLEVQAAKCASEKAAILEQLFAGEQRHAALAREEQAAQATNTPPTPVLDIVPGP